MQPKTLHNLLLLLEKGLHHVSRSLFTVIYEKSMNSWFLQEDYHEGIQYYTEIIRFYNSINFILNFYSKHFKLERKILRSWYFYLIYCVIWEHQTQDQLIEQIMTQQEGKHHQQILIEFINLIIHFSWDRALEKMTVVEQLSLRYAIPSFTIQHLLSVMEIQNLEFHLKAMNPSPKSFDMDIRLNVLPLYQTNQEETGYKLSETQLISRIHDDLKQAGIPAHRDSDFTYLFHIPSSYKQQVKEFSWFKKGYLVFHDKGSLAVIQTMQPRPEELILDMCASPGMKSSLIAQITHNRARIIANEIDQHRMHKMVDVLYLLQVVNIHLILCDSRHPPFRFDTRFDKILIDAPCSGSGTFLSDPDAKWVQSIELLMRSIEIQKDLLETSFELVKNEGTIVYATCSLYPEEGESQIIGFLTQHKHHIQFGNLPNWFDSAYNISNIPTKGIGRLFPAIQHTQGFFISKILKK